MDAWRPSVGGRMIKGTEARDAGLNLIYVTTGNPQPVVAYKNRPGANLFTASLGNQNVQLALATFHAQFNFNVTAMLAGSTVAPTARSTTRARSGPACCSTRSTS